MIQRALVAEWRHKAPWALDEQVEQDLIISRALVELYSEEIIRQEMAFRGGTALNKLFLPKPERYSEDIDLVQVEGGPIGRVLDVLHRRLDPLKNCLLPNFEHSTSARKVVTSSICGSPLDMQVSTM
jgi:hypothetical protein